MFGGIQRAESLPTAFLAAHVVNFRLDPWGSHEYHAFCLFGPQFAVPNNYLAIALLGWCNLADINKIRADGGKVEHM